MILRVRIYNLYNKSFTPIEVIYTGPRWFITLKLFKLMCHLSFIYRKHGTKTKSSEVSMKEGYDVVIHTEAGVDIMGIVFDEDEDYSNFALSH